MLPAGHVSKPTNIPITAEEEKERGMEFDDNIYYIEVVEREAHEKELKQRAVKLSSVFYM